MIHIFEKGELNKLNDLNQDLKTIYDSYVLTSSGIIFGESLLHKGSHMVRTDFKLFFDCPEGYVIRIFAKMLFTTIKDNKKKITLMKSDRNVLCIGNDDELFMIGAITKDTPITMYKDLRGHDITADMNLDPDNNISITLSSNLVEALVANEYMNVRQGKYRTRITKEVIPGLKKSHKVEITFFDHSKEKTQFFMSIKVHRNRCVSYHTYNCLFM